MRRRVPTATFALALLLVSALYAPSVEAAGAQSIPLTVGNYITGAINFVAALFDISPASGPSQSAAVAAGQAITASPHMALATGGIKSANTPTGSFAAPAVTVSRTGTFATNAGLRAALDKLAFALTKALAASRPAASVATVGGGYSDSAPTRTNNLSFSNLTVNGVTGLTAADIPSLASEYLSTSGGTITGNLTVTGAALSLANASTTQISAMAAYFGGTATSTFDGAGDLTVNGITALQTLSFTKAMGSAATTTSLFAVTGSFSSLSIGATATSTFGTDGSLTMNSIGHFNGGLAALASTTIGNGTQNGGLTVTGGATTTGALVLTGNKTYSGASGTANSWLVQTGTLSGIGSSGSDGQISPLDFYITGGTVDTMTNGPGYLTDLSVRDNVQAHHTGGRTAIQGEVNVVGTPDGVVGGAGYVGVLGITRCAANFGGTSGAFANYKGDCFGGNTNAYTDTGGSYLAGLISLEADVGLLGSGTSAAGVVGVLVQRGGNVGSRGDYEDAGIQIGASLNTTTWKTGLQFGAYKGDWPFGADSTMILAQQGWIGTPIALNGVDFRAVAFQPGGYAFSSRGFTVDPSGNLTGASLSGSSAAFGATATSSFSSAGALTLATALTVPNGGTGWGSVQSGALPYGNGTSALATTTQGTAGQVLAFLNGIPTWTATTTLSTISGTLATNQGGTGTTTWQTGSIPFFNGTRLTEDNSNFFWDGTNHRLGIGTTSPATTFSVAGNSYLTGGLGVGELNTAANTIDVSSSGSYKQAGNTILYASSTPFLTLVGIGAGSNIITTATSSDLTSSPGATALGYQALGNATSSGQGSVAIGYQALKGSATVSSPGTNTAVGYMALTANGAGSGNTAIGYQTLKLNTSGSGNVAIGSQTLPVNTTGGNNVGIGGGTIFSNQNGGNNVAIGTNALFSNVSSGQNTAIGVTSLFGTTGSNNTALGFNAGGGNTSGSKNVFVGTQVASTTSTGSNNIAIGYDIALPSTNGSNQLDIGNLIFGTGITGESTAVSGNVGVGTSTPYSRFTLWGADTAAGTAALTIANSASTTEFQVFDDGHAVLAGTLTQNSDARLKADVQTLDASSSLAEIEALSPVSYQWVNGIFGGGQQLGFIAQNVEQIFPQLVSTTSPTALTPNGTLGLNYTGLIAPIVGAIKALAADLTSLEATVAGFADSFTTKQLCLSDANGTTCYTRAQLNAVLSGTPSTVGQGSGASAPAAPAISTPDASSTPTTASSSPNAPTTTTADTSEQGSAAAPSDPSAADAAPSVEASTTDGTAASTTSS